MLDVREIQRDKQHNRKREKQFSLQVAEDLILYSLQVRTHTLDHQDSHWSEDIQGNKKDSSFLQESKEDIKV